MINPRRQHQQIPLLQPNPYPALVAHLPDVEIPRAVEDVADLLVLVHVLGEEGGDLGLVHGAHGRGRDGDGVAVLVAARGGQGVEGGGRGGGNGGDGDVFVVQA